MKDVLIGLKPDRFEDIIAVVSLYRPGPMENIPTYINRKHGKEEIVYMHPDLEEILDETYGIFIYQEQVLRAAQILANFSLGSADILRRAMGKKDKNEMFEQKQSFLLGAKKKNINESKATEIFDQISALAGYGFNKSHAAAYALIAYQTAWIKCNHPEEFFASMMTVEYNNNEKLSIFVEDLKKINISILPPCVNNSSYSFIIQKLNNNPSSIRYSLSALKNVGYEAVQKIIDVRNDKGKFESLDDFLNKVPYSLLTKKLLESLIMSGSFDCLDINRNKLFNSIDLMQKNSSLKMTPKIITSNAQTWIVNRWVLEFLGAQKHFKNVSKAIIFTGFMSARSHWKRGSVDTALLRSWGPWIAFGVVAGTVIGGNVSGTVLTLVFAAIAALVAINMAFKPADAAEPRPMPGAPLKQVLSTIIGLISVMMGIGGGTLAVPILSFFTYPIRLAVGTAAAIGLIIAIPGTIGYALFGLGVPDLPPFSLGYVNLAGLIAIIPTSMLTAPLGVKLAHAIPQLALRWCFAGFLAITSIRMITSIF